MVSACLAWPGLHIAFVEAGKQSQISFDSWHTVFLDSVYLHMHAPLKRVSMKLVLSEEVANKHTHSESS